MARLIDANAIITALIYDEEQEETQEVKMSIADFLDSHTVEGCPQNGVWISVTDELPKKKGDYLIYNTDGLVWPYWYDDGWYDSNGYISDSVTHWMPLPEPPEKEK